MSTAEQELSRRERKKVETRERLLTAAWALFREKGFEATTVEEITNAADVAKGTFFNYFTSKEDMLGPLAAWRLSQLWDDIDVSKGAPRSPLSRIKRLAHGLSYDFFPDSDLARRVLPIHLCRQPDREHPPLLLRRAFTDLVREAQGQGEIRADIDPRFIAGLLIASCLQANWHRHHTKEEPGPEADIERVIDILLEGLGGSKWRSN